MTGGAGNDSYLVDDAGDEVVEAAGGGTDRVTSSVTFTLGADASGQKITIRPPGRIAVRRFSKIFRMSSGTKCSSTPR
jgi:Ca2+-binding RTX toxin-like protein